MAAAAGDWSNAEVAGIDEADEFGRLVVEERVGPHRIGGARPGVAFLGVDVGGLLGEGVGIAAVAIGAAEVDIRAAVHVADTCVAGDAALALGRGGRGGLAGEVGPQVFLGQRQWVGGLDRGRSACRVDRRQWHGEFAGDADGGRSMEGRRSATGRRGHCDERTSHRRTDQRDRRQHSHQGMAPHRHAVNSISRSEDSSGRSAGLACDLGRPDSDAPRRA